MDQGGARRPPHQPARPGESAGRVRPRVPGVKHPAEEGSGQRVAAGHGGRDAAAPSGVLGDIAKDLRTSPAPARKAVAARFRGRAGPSRADAGAICRVQGALGTIGARCPGMPASRTSTRWASAGTARPRARAGCQPRPASHPSAASPWRGAGRSVAHFHLRCRQPARQRRLDPDILLAEGVKSDRTAGAAAMRSYRRPAPLFGMRVCGRGRPPRHGRFGLEVSTTW